MSQLLDKGTLKREIQRNAGACGNVATWHYCRVLHSPPRGAGALGKRCREGVFHLDVSIGFQRAVPCGPYDVV